MIGAERIDRVPELKRALSDARQVCRALGLDKGAEPQRGGYVICCPVHGDRNPSCSVSRGDDGLVRVHCFTCGFAGDVLHLIAAVRGLDLRRGFPEVIEEAVRLAGLPELLEEPRAKTVDAKRTYPMPSEIASVWQRAVPVTEHAGATAWLASRGLDAERLAAADVARAIPDGLSLPWWASWRGKSWTELRHQLLIPVFDHMGEMRSLRAGELRAVEGKPKRLPPGGHLSKGLVLANKCAQALFGHGAHYDLLIVEGEPDFLTWATESDLAVVGVGSGWWSRAHAKRVPAGTKAVLRTHQDEAGDRYANEIGFTLARRATLRRPAKDDLGDENDRVRADSRAKLFAENTLPYHADSVDPKSFFLGRSFAEHYWLDDELKPGVFAARCPNESFHEWGERFDGATTVRAPEQRLCAGDGTFHCAHPFCRAAAMSSTEIDSAMRRLAATEEH